MLVKRSRTAANVQLSFFPPEPPVTFRHPDTGTAELYADPTALIVSCSGGLDSDYVALWVRRMWPNYHMILLHFIVPGMDWSTTANHLQTVAGIIGNCTIVTLQAVHELTGAQTRSGMNSTRLRRVHDFADGPITDDDDAVIKDLLDFTRRARLNNPPTKSIRFCTRYYKSLTSDAWCRQNRKVLGDRAILFSGERWAESTDRSDLPHWEERDIGLLPCKEWPDGWRLIWVRPAIERILHEVAQVVYSAGIPLNESYRAQGETWTTLLDPERDERGRARHSCVICIFSRPHHIAVALDNRPDLVADHLTSVHEFEQETGKSWQQNGFLAVETPTS